jgi:glycosyltransferase involved in cell wall biosynthesis
MKNKVLLISDHLGIYTGVAHMSRGIVRNSQGIRWCQIGAGKGWGESAVKVGNHEVPIIEHRTYGTDATLREALAKFDPDAVLFFADPWAIRSLAFESSIDDVPKFYYHVWDNWPTPDFNRKLYERFDRIYSISGLTHDALGKMRLDNAVHVPHGVDSSIFKPIMGEKKRRATKNRHFGDPDCFVVFWNNKNLKRKVPQDLIRYLSVWKSQFSPDRKIVLLMKTEPQSVDGYDLAAMAKRFASNLDVRFLDVEMSRQQLNVYYNVADLTVNIAKNEGFGLSTLESQMAGTPVLLNETGGLQDQITDLATVARSNVQLLEGNLQDRYIFEDYVTYEVFREAMTEAYKRHLTLDEVHKAREDLIQRGMTEESMGRKISEDVNEVIKYLRA